MLVAAVLVVSLVFAVVVTGIDAPWAFFSLPGRAWQLALGGLLAVGAQRVARLPWQVTSLAGWAGLAAVIASVVLISPDMPYPGLIALVPSLGAAGLILSGRGRMSVGALLAIRPLRFLGRISFSLYLVHWPILVLPAAVLPFGEELPLTTRALLALASVGVAVLSYKFIEQPFHRGWLSRRPSAATLSGAAAGIVAVVLIAVTFNFAALARLKSPSIGVVSNPEPVETLPGGVETPPPWIEPDPSDSPHTPANERSHSAASRRPTDRPTDRPTSRPNSRRRSPRGSR